MPAAAAAVDDLLVAHRTARLHDGADAGVDQHLRARRRTGRTRPRRPPSPGALARRPAATASRAGVDAVDLAHADADRRRRPWPAGSRWTSPRGRRARRTRGRRGSRRRRRRRPRGSSSPGRRRRRRRGRRPASARRRETGRISTRPCAGARRGARSSRMFFFSRSSSSASSSKPGATTTSVKTSATWLGHRSRHRAVGRDHAAERRHRVARVRPAVRLGDVGADAMPHGLACLMMATAGSAKSYAARRAASAST